MVVYPGAASGNPRYNGRGAYYENLIMYAPVKLQGVGPGGVRPDNTHRPGLDHRRLAFGGDTTLATNWLGKVSSLTWDGNQDINDGQVIYVLASDTGSPTSTGPARSAPPSRPPSTASISAAATSRVSPATSTRSSAASPDLSRLSRSDPGRRHLRQFLRPQPADHQQRDREQRRLVRRDPHRHAQPARRPIPTSRTTICASPTTASSPTAAPTWPAPSASSPAPRTTKSPTTTSAATSRRNMAAASATSASARTARSTTTASTSTAPTMKAAGS